MKTKKQEFIERATAQNEIVLREWEKAYNEMISETHYNHERLRSCTAETFETENYIFLRSYRTVVAFIDKHSHTLYDVLRYVYGYTSTSAQHISKFWHDFYVLDRMTYISV